MTKPSSSSITTGPLTGVAIITLSCSPVKNTFNSLNSFENFSRGFGREAKMKFEDEAQKNYFPGNPFFLFL